MLKFLKKVFVEDAGLKIFSLLLAIIAWFYIVNELDRAAIEERALIQKFFPAYGTITKKLMIRPVLVGTLRKNYRVAEDKILVVPDYCIVVGLRDILKNIEYISTVPIDISAETKTFTRAVPLTPIAPGIFTEETLVTVTIPIEKTNP